MKKKKVGNNMLSFKRTFCNLDRVVFFALLLSFSLFAQFKNVRVDAATTTDAEEVTIAINTKNPAQVAAGANIYYNFFSSDSALNWKQGTLTSSLGVWGDPCVIYDGLGNLFFAHLSYPGYVSANWIDRIVVQRSTDNGKTWNDGVGVFYNPPKQQDKEWLAVDLHSQYKNNLYTSWTEFDKYGSTAKPDSTRILFSRSTNQGETWSRAVKVSDKGGNCIDEDNTVEGAVPAVGPNGEVYVAWSGPLGIMFDRTIDGGLTFGKDIFVTSQPGGWDFWVPGINRCNGLPITLCDTSSSVTRGNVYVCWGDQRNGTDNSDVFVIKSTDGGNTWGDVVRVNNDNTTRHQFFPWMTIDQTTGNLYAVFYDRRNTAGYATDVYLAKSSNGGESFDNFKISESSFTPTSTVFFGDYTNIAAFNKKVYPIWMRLDGQKLSVYTALITDTLSVVNVKDEAAKVYSFQLYQNFPNPFNPTTSILYNLENESFVTLKVFDVLGKEVEVLVNETKSAGQHEIFFNAKNIASGIYFYSLSAGNIHQMKKMIFVK
ncbi:MAG: T9SS type A sorting domain-containing protein [Ignavibacteriaceae bacterium]|nr:T9SS type A sorting domain-containing protein [Ignavibacteriaceae bacterium]